MRIKTNELEYVQWLQLALGFNKIKVKKSNMRTKILYYFWITKGHFSHVMFCKTKKKKSKFSSRFFQHYLCNIFRSCWITGIIKFCTNL